MASPSPPSPSSLPAYVAREQKAMDRLFGKGLNDEERALLAQSSLTSSPSLIGTCNAMPNTAASLLADFKRLGLKPGMNVIVHSSMSKLGWCVAAPDGICYALLAAVNALPASAPAPSTLVATNDIKGVASTTTTATATGTSVDESKIGTIVMPAFSSGNTDPKIWHYPPAPKQWHSTIRRHMSPFNPTTTPTESMGNIAECFRSLPGAHRSYHPECSFAAIGRHAALITRDHSLSFCMGTRSPLASLYQLNGYVLLLGVTHSNNTSIHYAETKSEWHKKHIDIRGSAVLPDRIFDDEETIRSPSTHDTPTPTSTSTPIPISIDNGHGNGNGDDDGVISSNNDTWPLPSSRWVTYRDIDYNDDDFEEIGAAFTRAHPQCVTIGMVGAAKAILVQQPPLIDFAVKWIDQHRSMI